MTLFGELLQVRITIGRLIYHVLNILRLLVCMVYNSFLYSYTLHLVPH
jgi:hypothetical protein